MTWTKEMDETLRLLHPMLTNREISDKTGWRYKDVVRRAGYLKLTKPLSTKQRSAGITPWTRDQILFLKENHAKLTNRDLAVALGYRLTVVRNKAHELGLKRMEMEYWCQEQVEFLLNNYQTLGDVEIKNHFQQHFPKKKPWTRRHIHKKRVQMNLYRTSEQIKQLARRNSNVGGPSYTIHANSASKNLPDKYVANSIAWRDRELRDEILKHPALIHLKRRQILLARSIKEVKHGS